MTAVVQSAQTSITGSNKPGFTAEKKETLKSKDSLKAPEDKFIKKNKPVKKEGNTVRNSAVAGALLELIDAGWNIYDCGGFSKMSAQLVKELHLTKFIKSTTAKNITCATFIASCVGIASLIGAGLGVAYKHFTKKHEKSAYDL